MMKLVIVGVVIALIAILSPDSDAATIKRCGNVKGSYTTARNLTASRGTQCQFARLVFFNWEVDTAKVPGSTHIHGYICRSRFVGDSIAVNCTTRRFFIRWSVPIEGEN